MPKIVKQSPKKLGYKKKQAKGVVDRIDTIKLLQKGLTFNLYGRSGTGKTVLASSFPKKALLIGAEDGTNSVHDVKGLDFVPLAASSEVGELVDYLRDSEYKTVILDTATMLQDIILKEILEIDELPAQRSWGMASREDWGQCSLQTKERLRSLLNLSQHGIHVIIVAQEREFNSESDSDIIAPSVGSALSPSVTGWLNPACDYICQTFIRQRVKVKEIKVGKKLKRVETTVPGKVDYCIRVGPDPTYTTKFRRPKGSRELPDVIVDPTYEKILNLIKSGE